MAYRKWIIEHFACLKTAEIPDHRTRLYKYNRRIHLVHGRDSIMLSFIVAAHVGKHDAVFEIFHSGVEDNNTIWTPVSPSTFNRLFKTEKGEWWFGIRWTHGWTDKAEVIVKDDRVLLKFSMAHIKTQVWGINLDTIASTLPAFLVSEKGRLIAIAEKYPGVKSMDDAETAWNAFDDFHTTEWQIRDKYFDKQRDDILKLVKKGQDDLASCDNDLQEICDNAADAMNTLSQKYGIEVVL